MRSGVSPESESDLQVFLQMFDFFNVVQQLWIEGELSLLFSVNVLLVFVSQLVASGEKLLVLVLNLFSLEFLKVAVVDLIELNFAQIYFGGGGDHVGLVDSSKGNSVDLVGAGNKEKSCFQLFQENYSSALKSTR